MKRYSSIDAMKAIAAFLVVCIHVPLPSVIGEAVTALAATAVPLFFVISGFFLIGANKDIMLERIIKHIKAAVLLVVGTNLLYLCWYVSLTILSNESVIGYFSTALTLESLVKCVLFNESPFAYHLWYLSAYLYVIIIYYFVIRFNLLKISYYAIAVLLLVDLIFGKYSLIIIGFEWPSVLLRNFIFVGMPYFLLGNFIRYKTEYIISKKINNIVLILGMLLFSITTLLEKYILIVNDVNAAREHYLSTTLFIICAIVFLIQNPSLLCNSWIETVGNKYSKYIYIIHPIIISIIRKLVKSIAGGKFVGIYSYVAPLIIYFLCIICITILFKLKQMIFIGSRKTKSVNS